MLEALDASNYETALAIAELPEQIRGYGHVKEKAVQRVRTQEQQLQARLMGGKAVVVKLFEPAA